MQRIDSIDVRGKRVFVRADFNVPIAHGVITETFRIEKTYKTIDYLLAHGAQITLASHIETEGEKSTLLPVFEYLRKKYPIAFIPDYYPIDPHEMYGDFSEGSLMLLENLRKYRGEKENDQSFAKFLAQDADIYVNEAFAASHREHASIVSIPKYLPAYAGFVFDEEVRELSKVFHPEHPFFFVLGGAKFETKLPLIKKFFQLSDTLFIGGALANDFLKAKGKNIGTSLVSKGNIEVEDFLANKLLLPTDAKVKNNGNMSDIVVKKIDDLNNEDFIVDVGPKTIEDLGEIISKAKYILWNGPLGNYEMGFKDATLSLAKKIASSDAVSIVGGGDTIASIAELGLSEQFSFISTGGGAMLEFLSNETLPGIQALESNSFTERI